MSREQLTDFLKRVQDDPALRRQVTSASTADDVAQIAAGLGYEFSGDELLRASGQKIGRVTITKQDVPGEYN
jgi:predicted ribosomally synthesized peptide with nif11-like leader